MVWEQVRALLEDPSRVADEYRRRISQASGKADPPEQVARLDRQITTIQRGIDRLIDCYAGGYIEKAEFEPRIAGLKLRRSQLEEQKRAAIKAANSECELSLVVSRLEDFSAKVSHGLDRLDWLGMREIIHTVVRRIEIDHDSIEVVFRVPPTGGPPEVGRNPLAGVLGNIVQTGTADLRCAVSKDGRWLGLACGPPSRCPNRSQACADCVNLSARARSSGRG